QIEHLAATFLRNDPEWADRIVYWGPMGCCTGSYLLMQGELEPADILPLMRRMWKFIADFEGEIPGATARDCGNYTFNDLPAAKDLARRYLTEVLADPRPENLVYPAD
ncbi:MAG: S-ribosylhomocysteine lyase, partial [Muribaculaceae bacterium]|nr:S-ribosylhomocysteine lyase [Muribaculaceae bacterium]